METPEGKISVGRYRLRWEDYIKMYSRPDTNWIHLVVDREQWRALVSTVMKLRVP
jgi:hypothetical protein